MGTDGDAQRDDSVSRAVEALSGIERDAGWARVQQIASVVARYFFDDDFEQLATNTRSRTKSIRRLSAHPRCPFSRSRLDELLAAYEVYRTEPLVQNSSLLPGHVAAVARLDHEQRHQLLEAAVAQGLSVRELKCAARRIRREGGERRGRPPALGAEKAGTRLENASLLIEEAIELLEEAGGAGFARPKLEQLVDGLSHLLEQTRVCLRSKSGILARGADVELLRSQSIAAV
jgi:hypothetical protein